MVEGGTTLGEAVGVARLAGATGAVDYINTTVGVATATLHMVVAGMRMDPGYAMHVPAAIRAAVGIPVIGPAGHQPAGSRAGAGRRAV